MTISIITACYNSAAVIRTAMESVLAQTWPAIEYLVIDGGSTDGTVDIIREYEKKFVSSLVRECVSENADAFAVQQIRQSGNKALKFVSSFVRECVSECSNAEKQKRTRQFIWLSERDRGMYDAINKGIRMATGEVIGILNADDVLSKDDVIERVALAFGMQEEISHRGTELTESEVGGQRSEVGGRGAWQDRHFETRPQADETVNPAALPRLNPETSGSAALEPLNQAAGRLNLVEPDRRSLDAIFGDIRFVANRAEADLAGLRGEKTVRYYSAKQWRPWMLQWGFMPPHPSVYIRKECFERLGQYALDYKIAADYALLIRFLRKAELRSLYVPMCFVDMRVGGMSTKNWRSNLLLNQEIVRGNREAGYFCCLPMLLPKYAFKVWEFVGPRVGRLPVKPSPRRGSP